MKKQIDYGSYASYKETVKGLTENLKSLLGLSEEIALVNTAESIRETLEKTAEEHYKGLEELANGLCIEKVICDPSAASFIQCIRRHGKFTVQPAKNDVVSGIRLVSDCIKDGRITEEARAQVNLLLKQSFRPEFLNRIDDIVFYKPLDKEEIFKITDLMLEEIRKRLKERRLDVKLTDRAKNYLAETGYDPQYGARPLKRLLSSKLETLLARKIIEGAPAPDTVFTVDYDGENLTVSESKGE